MDIFELQTYKDVLQFEIGRAEEAHGYKTRLSECAGISASYLSQVLRIPEINLNPDQAMAICEFWNYDSLRTSYFLKLVDLARASSERLRSKLTADIMKLRLRRSYSVRDGDTGDCEEVEFDTLQAQIFYSQWYFPAIQQALLLKGVGTSAQVARVLALPVHLVEVVLARLRQLNLVEWKDGIWSTRDLPFVYDDGDAAVLSSYHPSVRHRVAQRLVEGKKPHDGSVTHTVAVKASDLPKMRQKFFEYATDFAQFKDEPDEKHNLAIFCLDLITF